MGDTQIYLISHGGWESYSVHNVLSGPVSIDIGKLFQEFISVTGLDTSLWMNRSVYDREVPDYDDDALQAGWSLKYGLSEQMKPPSGENTSDYVAIQAGSRMKHATWYDIFVEWLVQEHGFSYTNYFEAHL